MIAFNRSQVVGAEFLDDDTVRFHGVQDDHIYGMQIRMDVRVTDGEILAIQGWMKRYTTPVCPKAEAAVQNAVGMSVREEGWESRVNREVGRKGCGHLAEILIECGRCLDRACLARDLTRERASDPGVDEIEYTRRWIREHPEFS